VQPAVDPWIEPEYDDRTRVAAPEEQRWELPLGLTTL
jgi:hypothetical protein